MHCSESLCLGYARLAVPRACVTSEVACACSVGSVVTDHPSYFPFCHRPLSTQNCWTDVCSVYWRVSLWTVCTATCGNYGFQSRRVDCMHVRTNKPVLEHHCSWRPRPTNWQRCNITPCENGTLLRGGEAVLCQGRQESKAISQKQSTRPCCWASWETSSLNMCKTHSPELRAPAGNGAHCGLLAMVLVLGLCSVANSMWNGWCSLNFPLMV